MTVKGINYFSYLDEKYSKNEYIPARTKPRVFISHQKKDSEVAKAIADYLLDAGIDIYFDQFDKSIDRSNPHSVVTAIQRGIANSSHMLVVFSPNTLGSMWVPWEIGYAYNSPVSLGVLRIKGIPKDELPEYLRIVAIVSDIWDLNQLISNLTKTERDTLITEGRIRRYSDSYHPLSQYMDSI
jgi:hypothetical protein